MCFSPSVNFPIIFEVVYEYTSQIFDESHGLVFVNGEEMDWNPNDNRWEFIAVKESLESVSFSVSDIEDHAFYLESINEDNPRVLVEWVSKGIPGLPVESLIVGVFLIALVFIKRT